MQNLYRQCLEEANIKKSIQKVLCKSGSNTAGPDKITKNNLPEQSVVIKEVKLRLRRYRKVCSRKVEIPKTGGSRELTIINLYDRIAQQCVYNIIQPIIEKKFSEHSYGFRTGISAKIPVSKVADILLHIKGDYYTVEIDFKKCFENILLEKAISELMNLGIKDNLLLKTIKHLMFIDREYNGIGLGQGTILGPLLCNCYLNKLDRFIETEFETVNRKTNYLKSHEKHKKEWLEWLVKKEWPIHCRYFRYADDTLIICRSEEEQKIIKAMIEVYTEQELKLTINQTKSKAQYNKPIEFLGFKLTKTDSISIRIANEVEKAKEIKNFSLNTKADLMKYLKYILGTLRYFDICNGIKPLIDRMQDRLFIRGVHRKLGILEKVKGHQIYRQKKSKENRELIVFDIWKFWRDISCSYKDYLVGSEWIRSRELILEAEENIKGIEHDYNKFAWLLFTRQKGKDPLTGLKLKIGKYAIHHIVPIKNGGSNDVDNLLLVSKETHRLIHNNEETSNTKIKWYRNKALKR